MMTADEKWRSLQVFIKGYILFDKIDRCSGNTVLALMEEIDAGE